MKDDHETSSGGDDKIALITRARRAFHSELVHRGLLAMNGAGVASISDTNSRSSREIAGAMIAIIRGELQAAGDRLAGQTSGRGFEKVVEGYLVNVFPRLDSLRWGRFTIAGGTSIAAYEQYEHLFAIDAIARANPTLHVALGADYLIKPDIVIFRDPEPDDRINAREFVVDETVARRTPVRLLNNKKPILHASVSCKLTLRSDRAQNARSEALNLIRNRKGRLPHTAVVTAEPMAGRIASLALGTGDIDCVYHIALDELRTATKEHGSDDSLELLDNMIDGKRLRDISDLPLDLTI